MFRSSIDIFHASILFLQRVTSWYVNGWKSGALKVKFLRSFGSCRVLEYIYIPRWICWTKALYTTGREMQSLEPVTRRITNNTARDPFNFQQILIFQNDESLCCKFFSWKEEKFISRNNFLLPTWNNEIFFFKFMIASRKGCNWVLNSRKS